MAAKKKAVQKEESPLVKYSGANAMYRAVETRNEADKYEALANIQTYFENSAGIGEHPEMVKEVNGQMKKLSTAEGNLEVLKKWFSEYNPNNL